MCNVGVISESGKSLVQDAIWCAGQLATKVVEGASSLAQYSWAVLSTTAQTTEKVFRSPDAFHYALLGITSAINAVTVRNAIRVSEEVLRRIDTAQFVMSATRVIQSISYFASGKLFEEIIDGKLGAAVGQVCFFLGRVGSTLNFLVQHNLANLQPVVQAIGNIPVFGQLALKALTYPLIDMFFIGGMVGFVAERFNALIHFQNPVFNIVSLINLVSEIAFMKLMLNPAFVAANPLVIPVLGVVVATAGVASFLCEPVAAPARA